MGLDDYLENQAEAGSHHSEGEFTVSPEEAWRKMQHTLPDPSYWILKVVQAAHFWEADRMSIQEDGGDVGITFETEAEPGLQVFDLQTGDRGLKHLQVALAALLADQTVERAALAWSSCGACFSAVCHESKLETSTTAGGHYTGSRFELRVSYKGVSWFKQLVTASSFSKEKRLLGERLVSRRMPVFINSKPVPLRAPPEGVFLTHFKSQTFEFSYHLFRELSMPRYMDWARNSNDRRRRKEYGSHFAGSTKERILWNLDGVMVREWATAEAPSAVCGEVHLCADGLTLDLSGFGVREDERSAELLRSSVAQRAHYLKRTLEDLPKLLDHEAERQKVKKSYLGVDLLVGIVFPPYLLLGLVELYRLPRTTDRLLKEDLEQVTAHIERRISCLAG